MCFGDALENAKLGMGMRRARWEDGYVLKVYHNSFGDRCLRTAGRNLAYRPTSEDLFAEDWISVELKGGSDNV